MPWTPKPIKHTQFANVKRDSPQSESDRGRFPLKIGYPSKFGHPTDLTPGGLWEKDFQYRARTAVTKDPSEISMTKFVILLLGDASVSPHAPLRVLAKKNLRCLRVPVDGISGRDRDSSPAFAHYNSISLKLEAHDPARKT